MTRVKICGITREEDVDAVVDAGADALGFVSGFPNSPRNLTVSRAASLISRVPPFVTPVLVATAQTLVEHSDEIKRCAPKAIQLYGNAFSQASIRHSFHAYLLRPCAVAHDVGDEGLAALEKIKETVKGYDAILTDAHREGYDGGTGLTSDWNFCSAIRKSIAPMPLILSGGLRPENVELAIATVSPFCVDVSSGVESAPGVKDHSKVKTFVTNANKAEERRVAP